MLIKMAHRNALLALKLMVAFFVLSLVVWSCAGDYNKPVTPTSQTAQTAPLISPETLKSWIDSAFVNGAGIDRVVILDINTAANYDGGHIPGAHFVNTLDLYQTRDEGVAATLQMVLDGARMDALIRKYGIDGKTTVVFTSGNVSRDAGGNRTGGSSESDRCDPANPVATRSSRLLDVTRAYWTFRYWGFPQARLKVLDGINCAYEITYGQEGMTKEPATLPSPSTYSVRNNRALRSDLRASLSEMISLAEGKVANALPADFRSSETDKSYAGKRGSTAGVFSGPTGTVGSDFVVFEGKVKGATAALWTDLISVSTDNATGHFRFKPHDELVALMTKAGIDSSKTTYTYCRTGRIATSGFFVLDAILGWPAVMYDGSWSQWGQMSANATNGGRLAADSPWRTDIPSRSGLIAYNYSSIGPASFVGTGLNDLTSGGTYTGGGTDRYFRIQIDSSEPPPDKFKWSKDGGLTWDASNVDITGTEQTLSDGVTVTFGATAGHAVDDLWIFTAGPRKAIELLTLDGGACTSRLNLDGAVTSDPTSCTAITTPRSHDPSANKVEEEDAAYFGAGNGGGTGGGGSGGGGPSPGC